MIRFRYYMYCRIYAAALRQRHAERCATPCLFSPGFLAIFQMLLAMPDASFCSSDLLVAQLAIFVVVAACHAWFSLSMSPRLLV